MRSFHFSHSIVVKFYINHCSFSTSYFIVNISASASSQHVFLMHKILLETNVPSWSPSKREEYKGTKIIMSLQSIHNIDLICSSFPGISTRRKAVVCCRIFPNNFHRNSRKFPFTMTKFYYKRFPSNTLSF